MPWMTPELRQRVEDFVLVLKSRYPSVHDKRTRVLGQGAGTALAQGPWRSGRVRPHAPSRRRATHGPEAAGRSPGLRTPAAVHDVVTAAEVPSPGLPVRQAYRLWAPTYEDETAVSALDQWAVATLGPSPAGRALLDAGCGIGRRLQEANAMGASLAVGVDLVEAMVRRRAAASACAVADVRALPFVADTFDLVLVPPGAGPPPGARHRLW